MDMKGPFTHNETNETLKNTNQCDILDCVYFIMTFTHNEPVSLVSITNRHFRFVSKGSFTHNETLNKNLVHTK